VSVFPNNGIVEITITGRFAMISPTSVSHIATINVPSGNSDAMS